MLRIAARTMQALADAAWPRSFETPQVRLLRMRGERLCADEGREVVEPETSRHKQNPAQTKKDQLALALLVVRTDPIPTTPGGWGLRNPEPKGPGQRTQVFSQRRAAVAWRKSGDTMIPANDPVTV